MSSEQNFRISLKQLFMVFEQRDYTYRLKNLIHLLELWQYYIYIVVYCGSTMRVSIYSEIVSSTMHPFMLTLLIDFPVSADYVTSISKRLQNFCLVVRDLNIAQNEPQTQIFAFIY